MTTFKKVFLGAITGWHVLPHRLELHAYVSRKSRIFNFAFIKHWFAMLTTGSDFFPEATLLQTAKFRATILKFLYETVLQNLFKNEEVTRPDLKTTNPPTTNQTELRSQHCWYPSPDWNTGSPSVELMR